MIAWFGNKRWFVRKPWWCPNPIKSHRDRDQETAHPGPADIVLVIIIMGSEFGMDGAGRSQFQEGGCAFN
jgi:hypothetical protein